jgi:hypothetical protein
MLINLVCWLLRHKKFNRADKDRVITLLLDKIDALPLHAIITSDEGKLFIRGVAMEGEKAIRLREAAQAALHNPALEFVHEQVLYQAISHGVHLAQTTEQIQFSKAAIWYSQEEVKLLKLLANETPRELLA